MRVTSNTFPTNLVEQLNQLASQQNKFLTQAATGQRIASPQDDPKAMRSTLDLQHESKSLQQYQRNIVRHQEVAGATFDSIKALKNISDRATEIATLADNLKSPEELAIYAKEITEMIKQGVQIANTKHRDAYLFGGTQSSSPPFQISLTPTGAVSGVSYQGNSKLAASEIAQGITISSQIPGANSAPDEPRALITDAGTGADWFNHLISLQNNLLAGDTDAIAQSNRPQLAQDEENLILHLSSNAALQSRLEATTALHSKRNANLQELTSKEADADLAETLVRLQQTQTAYQAALQSGARLLSRSLLDFLR